MELGSGEFYIFGRAGHAARAHILKQSQMVSLMTGDGLGRDAKTLRQGCQWLSRCQCPVDISGMLRVADLTASGHTFAP